jgi:hypothetical protein
MKRKKSGRKPLPGGREKFTTTLPGYVVRHLRKVGNGNASAAICRLVDQDLKTHERARGPFITG